YIFDNQTRFGTTGPVPTTGLTVLDGSCGGNELGCTDPWSGPGYVITELAADQQVTVVLDALGDQGASLPGTGTVNVELVGPATCPAAVLDEVPSTFTTQTFTATNDFDWCSGWQSSVDTEVVFTAPADGTYTFDTSRSTIGTIIELRQGSCSTDPPDACIGYGGMTQFTYDMTAGQTITLNLESAYGVGHLTLDVGVLGGTCGDEDLAGALPITVSGTTDGADNTATACGRVASPDTTYTFTAPQEGFYFFEVDGVEASPYVAVHTPTCQTSEIGCAGPPDAEGASVAVASLIADQEVVVIVDENGVPTDYDLEVSRFECEQIGGPLPADFANPGGPDLVYPGGLGCGYGWASTDTFFEFTAPADGRYVFETWDEILMRFDGACGGNAIGCGTRWYNTFYQYTNARVTAALDSGEHTTLMISNGYGAPLHAEQLTDTCPDQALAGALPIAMGGLDLSDNDEVLSCAYTGLGNEATLSFTAPSAGNYRFSMSGVGGYGAIGVLDGCGGTELACAGNINYYPNSAITTVALAAGQAVVVVAEGAGSVSVELLP
ncbi:MAG TPA: hypothetical protein VG755_09630, partial [Nannocystaceae bacterium]|nr:hypothetical protein [Nannocystaceae bacterium]